jgi:hypothetical protein
MYLDNFAEMSNQELIHAGTKQMDQTDQAIERSKKVSTYIHSFFFVLSKNQKLCYCVKEEEKLPMHRK